ncbi:MAG: biopolymer transporter ExbD [Sandaracinaceae bacterium]|nr:biopolymer transporter ExbD [Sandaracinaceae bacterium]MBK6808356.1 biopolymer transporter ExbD [Sandaracinaceae bacterium]MBK7152024.1 biopolymer transporter ExbD [Sandaracinaceae bacterium]MBK7777113.1 biopolymer transporter ExbD [Sandaracinaceae bacterium]MBK8411658.1 biopolymer transporter ExbD [Sandaracinaceae bacterium]
MDLDTGHGKKKKKGVGTPEMNVTPLVDVVLVLLIIFMVVMPMMHAKFWIHVPPKADENAEVVPPDPNALQPIVVTVNAQGHIQINQDVYPDNVFPQRLRGMLVARNERKVYFDAADNVSFERAMDVMDLARGGGAAHIAVMTERLN